MPDVPDILRTLPHSLTPGPAGADIVAADLARGHRALISRRRRRIASSSAIIAGVTAVVVGAQAGHSVPTTHGARPPAPGLQLVAYTGTQPAGFTVSTVPAGWHVTGSDSTAFVVAPPGEKRPDARNDPDEGFTMVGRIAVVLQGMSRLPAGSPTTKVTIRGKEGVLGFPDDGDSRIGQYLWLIFPDAAGDKILVQVPKSLGLTNDQIVRFAQGITVTKDARPAEG